MLLLSITAVDGFLFFFVGISNTIFVEIMIELVIVVSEENRDFKIQL